MYVKQNPDRKKTITGKCHPVFSSNKKELLDFIFILEINSVKLFETTMIVACTNINFYKTSIDQLKSFLIGSKDDFHLRSVI